jgi:hypothetical protein
MADARPNEACTILRVHCYAFRRVCFVLLFVIALCVLSLLFLNVEYLVGRQYPTPLLLSYLVSDLARLSLHVFNGR